MKFHQDTLGVRYYIQAHAEDGIKVLVPPGEETLSSEPGVCVLQRSFIISPNQLLTDWTPQTLAELEPQHLALALEMNPELIILGSGPQLQFPDPAIFAPLMERGIGYEVMNTGAACRTHNVLAEEGRQVVTALLIS